jgi:hypothetical protein
VLPGDMGFGWWLYSNGYRRRSRGGAPHGASRSQLPHALQWLWSQEQHPPPRLSPARQCWPRAQRRAPAQSPGSTTCTRAVPLPVKAHPPMGGAGQPSAPNRSTRTRARSRAARSSRDCARGSRVRPTRTPLPGHLNRPLTSKSSPRRYGGRGTRRGVRLSARFTDSGLLARATRTNPEPRSGNVSVAQRVPRRLGP